jgi:hypothetical protein
MLGLRYRKCTLTIPTSSRIGTVTLLGAWCDCVSPTKNVEFGLARSLRGLCKSKNFLPCTPVTHDILARNGLSSLARNITARPCKTLLPPNLTGPKGGLRPSKRGIEPAFWVPAASYRNNTLFLLSTDSMYLCTYTVLHFLRDQGCKT